MYEMVPMTAFLHIIEAGFKIHHITKRNCGISFKDAYHLHDQLLIVKFNHFEHIYLVNPLYGKELLFEEMRAGVDVKICVDPYTYQALVNGGEKMIQLFHHCMLYSIWGILRSTPGREITLDAFQLAWLHCDLVIRTGSIVSVFFLWCYY